MGASLRIGRIAGIDIKLHFTFLLVVFLGAARWGGFGLGGALLGVGLTLLVFASVTLHELGHSLVAKAFGIPVRDITLTPLGGVAQLGARPKTPGQELLVALAGPAVNVAIALVLTVFAAWRWGLDAVLVELEQTHIAGPSAATVVGWLLMANVSLVVFNLIPALPMDGGRVLRALLTWPLGLEAATRWSSLLGRLIAVGFVVLGVLGENLILAAIGAFVFVAAGLELRAVNAERALNGVRARDAVNPYAPRFLPGTTLGEAMQAIVFTPYLAFAVEHFGRLLGVVTRAELMRSLDELGPGAYVAGVMRREVPAVAADASLEAARLEMNAALSPFVAVMDGERFLGLVTEMELAQASGVSRMLRPSANRGEVHASGW